MDRRVERRNSDTTRPHGDAPHPAIDRFRRQHLALSQRQILTGAGPASVTVDEQESPLAWLARRRGRDGRSMIEPAHLLAGERLRADFTSANMMPRVTSNWDNPIASGRRGCGESQSAYSDTMVISRRSVNEALEAVGPEFSGLLLDVCCFLKGLEDVERERRWPLRSAKVVLQLALARLARHYGLAGEARGSGQAKMRTWLAEDASGAPEG